MAKPNDVTAIAIQGFESMAGERCPFILSSVHGDAWALGKWFYETGRCVPVDVFKSRGNSYRAGDMKFAVRYDGNAAVFERIS